MKKKSYSKTILRIAPYPTYEESGRGLHPYELSKIKDIKVIYLTFFKKGASYFDIPENVKLCIGSFYTVPTPRNKGKLIRFLFELYRLLKISIFSLHGIFLMLKYKADIVHIHSPMFCLVSFVSKIFGKKNIISFHGADFFRIENALWYKIFARIFDIVFSISPRFINKLEQIHNCQVIQIYNGIDKKIYKNLGLKRKKQILAVANFKLQKGLKYLIIGFKDFIIKYGHKDYKLIIAGKGLLYEEISIMVDKLEMNQNVLLLGQKNRDDLIQIYNQSEVFILTSIWEGFAKVLLESMACGCKVISTKVDSAPLLLDEWGYMIDHSDSEAISENLNKIINDKKYPYDLQNKYLDRFSWDYIRNTYISSIKLIK